MYFSVSVVYQRSHFEIMLSSRVLALLLIRVLTFQTRVLLMLNSTLAIATSILSFSELILVIIMVVLS